MRRAIAITRPDTTGAALTYDGFGLKGWLGVQKMKEIKELVVWTRGIRNEE